MLASSPHIFFSVKPNETDSNKMNLLPVVGVHTKHLFRGKEREKKRSSEGWHVRLGKLLAFMRGFRETRENCLACISINVFFLHPKVMKDCILVYILFFLTRLSFYRVYPFNLIEIIDWWFFFGDDTASAEVSVCLVVMCHRFQFLAKIKDPCQTWWEELLECPLEYKDAELIDCCHLRHDDI